MKGAIKKSLPGIGSAAGGFPVPDEGASDGTQVAPPGLEPQSLSPEDQEFEVAKQLVRVAGAAAQKAASMPAAAAPVTAAKVAVTEAARRHAPGLLRGAAAAPDGPGSCPVVRDRPVAGSGAAAKSCCSTFNEPQKANNRLERLCMTSTPHVWNQNP